MMFEFSSDEEVLVDCKVIDQIKFLVDEGNPLIKGFLWGLEFDRDTVELNRPPVAENNSTKDIH